jgi:hypothetical protein
MSFSAQRNRLLGQLGQSKSAADYYVTYLTTDHRSYYNALKDRYVEQLFSDLIEQHVTKDIKGFLGKSYKNADEYARDCFVLIGHKNDLFGHHVQHWTESARKCFDNFLIVLIEDKLGEHVRAFSGIGGDRFEYQHLIEKGGNNKTIGDAFTFIYRKRSSMTHVKVTDETTGKRIQKALNKKELLVLKGEILEKFKVGLTALETEIN